MQPSIEAACRPSKQRMNIKVLTEVRENFENLKDTGSSFRLTRLRTHKNQEHDSSRLFATHYSLAKKMQHPAKTNYRKYGAWLPTTTNNDANSRLQAAK
jgi:hypothetical protein